MEGKIKLIPNWKINQRLIYNISKSDNFYYKNKSSKAYKREFDIELTKNNESVFEAYFPKSILYPVKLINIFDENIYNNSKITSRTFYYEVDKANAFEKLLNRKEIIASLIRNVETLIALVKNESDKEEFKDRIDIILETEKNVEKYLLKDIINTHYNNGLELELGYYYNLKKETIIRKIMKFFFGKSRFFLNKVHFIKFDFEDNFITIEYLKGSENFSSKRKVDWKIIEDSFINNEFDILDHKNITLNHEKYYYSQNDMLLNKYLKKHIVDTPNMRKEITNTISINTNN